MSDDTVKTSDFAGTGANIALFLINVLMLVAVLAIAWTPLVIPAVAIFLAPVALLGVLLTTRGGNIV
ncbi:hypothetical protein [Ferrovibrio sp.]|uniref:hypothetical protein n=1 Tax=Ferrovibrio sp. TaxID=1917215 RepID=UPI0025BC2F9E|nr:hypothetical protein [Ferrovibrio sp.]MBX3455841.1 hypothetical protein [Ferrovibrio sp.]